MRHLARAVFHCCFVWILVSHCSAESPVRLPPSYFTVELRPRGLRWTLWAGVVPQHGVEVYEDFGDYWMTMPDFRTHLVAADWY